MDSVGYTVLFGEAGLALSDIEWIDQANRSVSQTLSVLSATIIDGSRSERRLRMSYEPGSSQRNFVQLSGGMIAEMLDQTATHCGSLVTGRPCSTLSMTATILLGGTTKSYVSSAKVLKLTKTNAILSADLDDATGMRIASMTVVSQLISVSRVG